MYTIRALIRVRASVTTVSHFYHVEQTGSLFIPHPLLPHGNVCYYSQIILNSLPLLLIAELFRHNYLRPSLQSVKIGRSGIMRKLHILVTMNFILLLTLYICRQ